MRRSIAKGELTQSLRDRPILKPELLIFWDAFTTLSASRVYSLKFGPKDTQYIGPNAIGFSEIAEYMNELGMNNTEQRFRLIRIVQKMDAAYIDLTKG